MTAVERFFVKVKTGVSATDCWEWTACRLSHGYGQFHLDGKMQLAHRVAYAFAHGAIDADLTIDHLCSNRSCVNPAHMELVTAGENTRRAKGWKDGRCKRGHDLLAHRATTSGRFGGVPRSYCRECARTEWWPKGRVWTQAS